MTQLNKYAPHTFIKRSNMARGSTAVEEGLQLRLIETLVFTTVTVD